MKLSNKQIIESTGALQKILSQDLDIKTQFKLSKDVEELNKVISIYEGSRQKLITKYADKDKEGKEIIENGCYTFKNNNDEFNKDFNELNDIDSEINIEALTLNELEGIKLNNAEFNSIKFMVSE